MQDPAAISAALQSHADDDTARKRAQQIRPLRGIRGVPAAMVTRVLVESYRANPARLPGDRAALRQLFSTAFEDGLVAIGLAAAILPESAAGVLDLTENWLGLVDDLETADALGWHLLGPTLLTGVEPFPDLIEGLQQESRVDLRRAGLMACMALLPVPLEGPSAAAMRERTGQRRVLCVQEPQDALLERLLVRFMLDDEPHIRKALTRILKQWAGFSPEPVERILQGYRSRLPKFMREEVQGAIARGRQPRKSGR